VILTVFPDAVDVNLAVTTTDHSEPERGKSGLIALTVVARDSMGETMAKPYFSYFQPHFPARVFQTKAEARDWLKAYA
jgi:hypothetical protein